MKVSSNILIISPEPWNHIFVSKHHYAVHLAARGNRVFFLNPPSQENAIHSSDHERLKIVDYTGFPAGLRFYPALLRRPIVRKTYEKVQKLCGTEFDVVWSFDNSVFFDFDALPSRVTRICHIVDLNQDFQTGTAASTADLCFCTTDLIKQRLLRFNTRVFKINHGFNAAFQRVAHSPEISGVGIKALYAGNLNMPYIDWHLLGKVVSENPDVGFYFVGPQGRITSAERDRTLGFANAHSVGRVDASVLQGYYSQVDLLLITYHERYHREQANPHKMMEYLGSGRMIVATCSLEYIDISKDLFCMSDSNADFPAMFKDAIQDLAFWNSEEKQQQRKSVALDNTYEKQLDRIQELIASYCSDSC